MVETIAIGAGFALFAAVIVAVWICWMGFGLLLFFSQYTKPTGGRAWIAFTGVAVFLSGLGGAAWCGYVIVSRLTG